MAADAQVWTVCTASYERRKIYRLLDGSLFGAAGTLDHILRYREWLDGVLSRKPAAISLIGILVKPCGTVYMCEGSAKGEPWKVHGDYFAVGIGEVAALGAMFAGASARTAILAAARHTQGTGFKVHTARLHPRGN